MTYRFFTLGLTVLLLSACAVNEEEYSTLVFEESEEFHAIIEGATTKVYVDEDLKVLWHADDRVSIFNKYTYNQQYRFTGNTGANSGSFQKVPNEDFITGNSLDYVYAVYPYQGATEISNRGVLTVNLPATQAYAEDSFGIGANTMVSCSEGNELLFKNLCGYIMLKLYGDDVAVSSISLKGNNNEPLAGHATVTASVDGNPSLSFDETATDEITLTFDSPVTLGTTSETATVFWLVVPPTTFGSGITLTVTDDQNGIFEKTSTKSLGISRNTLSRMSALEVNPKAPDPDDYISQYLTFEILSEGSISWVSVFNAYTMPRTIEYSLNGGSWTEITSTKNGTSISVREGDLLRFRGNNESYGVLKVINSENRPWYNYFRSSCQFKVFGNIMSLINSTNFKDLSSLTESCTFFGLFKGCNNLVDVSHLVLPALTLTERCYWNMFTDCTSLVSAPELPAITLADHCYSEMFSGCNSLQVSPNLPATTLAPYCYSIMFNGCTSLTNAPELPATSLANDCYNFMFSGCTSLTKAPELPATTLIDKCYYYMFNRCSTLNHVKCLATDISANNCVSGWLYNVASTGTFVKAPGMNDWTTGTSGIPEGWSVINDECGPSCPEAVDLGLPSGIKWASFNLGASKPEEYGDYYAWGEIEPYYSSLDPLTWKEGKEAGYDWPSYKWCMGSISTLTKYCTKSSYGTVDNITELQWQENEGETLDDAARALLGRKWRMPRLADFEELINNTENAWTTYNGVNGWLFSSKTNSANWVFLPAAGFGDGGLNNIGSSGDYWSSSLATSKPNLAYYLRLDSRNVFTTGDYGYRYRGHSIRPVYAETIQSTKDTTYLARWWFDQSQVEALSEHFTESAKVNGEPNPDACLPGNGGLYVEPNVCGSGRIEFYNGVDKTDINPKGRVKRCIGSYGDICSYGTWKGDYYLLTANTEFALPAGTDIYTFFALRPHCENVPKYWLVEIKDGDTWKPYLKTSKVTVEGEGQVTYNLELVYEAAGDPVKCHDSIVDSEYKLTAATKDIQIRILAVSGAYAEGEGLPTIIGDGPVQTRNPVSSLVGNSLRSGGNPVLHHTMICVVK